MNWNRTRLVAVVILIVLVFIWGSSFILMKRGLEFFPSYQLAALRIIISFLVLLPFAIKHLKILLIRKNLLLVVAGILGNGIPAFLFAKAQTGINSYMAGILNSLTPLFSLLVGLIFFQLKTRWYNVLGVIVGLIGAIGLLSVGEKNFFGHNFLYGSLIVMATLMYAFNINIIKKYLGHLNSLALTSLIFFVLGIPASFYILTTNFIADIANHPQALQGLFYISILAILGTAAAVVAYNYLIKITSVLFAASVTYLIPIVAIMWGMADGEKLGIYHLLWMLVILLGVYLVNFVKKKID